MMNTEFQKYVQTFRVEKGKPFTHTSIGKPRASYFVSDEDQDDFIENYKNAVLRNEPLHMTEKHKDESPILIDLDFRFNDISNADRKYTNEHVREILEEYLKCISKYIEIDGCVAYVLEKPCARVDKLKLKDGIHVIIPNLICEPRLQMYFREKALPKFKSIFERIGINNTAGDCFDEAVIARNNWQMFGSCKPDQAKYDVTFAYRWEDDELVEEHVNARDVFPELLSIRNKGISNVIFVNDDVEADYTKYMESKKPVKSVSVMFNSDSNNVVKNQTHDIALSKKLVNILSVDRVENYEQWIRMGWCLRNIDYRLLEDWVAISTKSPKFVTGECEDLWDKMRVNGGLGIGSLKMWASEDNNELYKDIMREDIFSLVYKASSGTHYDVACVVKAMFGSENVCTSPKNKTWYEFVDHRWRMLEEGIMLSQKISVQVFSEFSHVASHFAQKAAQSTDTDIQKTNMDLNKKFTSVALKLKDSNYKSHVMKECMGLFYSPRFEEKLDSNCHLIGFENGVYDISTMEFREGVPEDYITFSTGINYTHLNTESLEYKGLIDYFEKVFPIKAVREYVLLHMASCLNGNIREERFHIWTGCGSNSKSKIVELFEKSFGDYCCKFSVSLLTNKRAASNAATGEIARAKGRRGAFLQEPSENETFNIGLMKEMTGGDRMICRPMYKDPFEFKPQFKMFLTANHLPEVKADDDGTWRRIRVIEFISKFTLNPNPNNPHEFLIDPDFSSKLDSWREVFMLYLIEKYKEYMKYGLREPEEVMKCTREYQKNNDFVSEFLEVCSQPSENAYVSVTEAYNIFKLWQHENNPDIKMPNRKEFIKYVSKQWGGITRGKGGSQGWSDYKMQYNPYPDEDTNDD